MPQSDKQPNILFIMTDQMRGDCLSLERHPFLLTPNMDAVGARGTHFGRAYTTSASCIPARRSLLTGQFPATNGMVGYKEGCPIIAGTPTLPQSLRDSGYATAIAGRYMHQFPYEESYGYEKRIMGSVYKEDSYFDQLEKDTPGSWGVSGHGIPWNGWTAKPWHLEEYLHPTNWVAGQSRNIIKEHDNNKPLFLTSSYYSPHPPFIPPAFYMERYLRMDLPSQPAIGEWASRPPNHGLGMGVDSHYVCLEGEALHSAQAGYFGLINHIDDQLHWLITDFARMSLAAGRPWLIAISADHGEMLGDHYMFRKCEPYEGSSRIPFLIQASPELEFKPGQTCMQPVCLEDLMPTLLDIADVEIPDSVDGVSLVPTLRGEEQTIRPWLHGEHAPCYSEQQGYHFLTDGRFKYIWRPHDGSEQLFDLDRDPDELKNLADDHSDSAEAWRTRLVEQLRDRPEGFVSDGTLVAGRPYEQILPHAGI